MKNTSPAPTVFGQFLGEPVFQVILGTPDGLQAKVMTWGAVLTDLSLPLAGGARLPLTLGFDHFDPYPAHSPYFGAVVGRYANRIAGGRFALQGRSHHLDRNEADRTTLHGGAAGFARRLWQIADLSHTSVSLTLMSLDGDQGFPGSLRATCTYSITEGHQLDICFGAATDRPTPVSLAHHAYFNLDGGRDTSDHSLQIHADAFTPVGPDQIPTGEIASVDGTAFDFRNARGLRALQGTFDHNFVLSEPRGDGLRPAAWLYSRRSGIGMKMETTKPGLQFYDGHKVCVPAPGLAGRVYGPKSGLCLEAQFFPDSPNQAGFPDSILRPNQSYAHRTLLSFQWQPVRADGDVAGVQIFS